MSSDERARRFVADFSKSNRLGQNVDAGHKPALGLDPKGRHVELRSAAAAEAARHQS
jgi:hypothetical protein